MATGPGLANLLPAAAMLVGILSILRSRRARRNGRAADAETDDALARRDAALEMERRMASYLAQRDMGRGSDRTGDQDGQENGR